MKEKLHVYTFEAKNLPNPMTRQQLPQELRGEHPLEMWGGLPARAGPAARQRPDLGVRLRTTGPPHVSTLVGAGLPA